MPDDIILLAHGDGGKLTHELVEQLFLRYLGNPALAALSDAAWMAVPGSRLAVTTDSFVVSPLFFPGGDIGKLAVCGTVNDLAVSGARPSYLTAGFIIEEGFPLADLEKIVASMARAAAEAGVQVVAGDTKVVGRGHGDGLFINTTGIGFPLPGVELGYHRVQPGDKILINGPVSDHGLAVITCREGLEVDTGIVSDCASLNGLIQEVLAACSGVHLMRDPTRGGVATTLKEIATSCRVDIHLEEESIPVRDAVRGAAEMLGLDPLYLANEGKVLIIVSPAQVAACLEVMHQHPLGQDAAIIGEVQPGAGQVYLHTLLGGTRYLDLLAGTPLPRIC